MSQPGKRGIILHFGFCLLKVTLMIDGQKALPPDMPQLENLDVDCAKDGMTVTVEFDKTFGGVIYSKGFYDVDICRFVSATSRDARSFTFQIPLAACGTVGQFEILTHDQDMYLENTVIIQNDPYIQEAWDQAKRLRCIWSHTLMKTVSSRPFEVYQPFTVPVTFTQDTINALMEVQVGKGPFAAPASGYLHVGDETSLVVYLQDPTNRFDAEMMGCEASNDKGFSVALTDENGCVKRPEMMTPFYKTRDTRDTGADLIIYSYFKAFKLPDTTHFYIRCDMKVCLKKCNAHCGLQINNKTSRHRRETDEVVKTTHLIRSLTVFSKENLEMTLFPAADYYCLSKSAFVIGGSVGVVVLILVFGVVVTYFKKIKGYQMLLKKCEECYVKN